MEIVQNPCGVPGEIVVRDRMHEAPPARTSHERIVHDLVVSFGRQRTCDAKRWWNPDPSVGRPLLSSCSVCFARSFGCDLRRVGRKRCTWCVFPSHRTMVALALKTTRADPNSSPTHPSSHLCNITVHCHVPKRSASPARTSSAGAESNSADLLRSLSATPWGLLAPGPTSASSPALTFKCSRALVSS
jgi:hypothetical protein